MADPMAVKIVVEKTTMVLVEHGAKGPHFPMFLCKGKELPQDCAKRILRSVFGLEAYRVVSLPVITRIAVEDIPEEERKDWPKGAKTIPCVAFSFRVEDGQKVISPYDWMYRRDGEQFPERSDRATLASL